MIFLFTDFGAAELYVGQVKAVLHQRAPNVQVVDMLHEAPAFNVKASAPDFNIALACKAGW